MEFIHRPYTPGETIAAVATPPGEGGIAVIRISGTTALKVAESIFSGHVKSYKSHTAHFGKILDAEKKIVDEVLLLPMLAPASYTGEDVVEIHCHGGSLITRRVLELVLKAGARAAEPGEFTFRAFINGKLDLSQAEAVQELIAAKNEHALAIAENNLRGLLSQKISSFQKKLFDSTAILEAWVDFPDEGLEFASFEECIAHLNEVRDEMRSLLETFHDGKIAHEGLSLCLIGPPNVGKSSLMNALLGKERAIVTEIPGTTRDLLEEEMRLAGLHFRLIDTAGIRATEELIEQEGIRRSKQAIECADLVLLVLDASSDLNEEQLRLVASVPSEKTILVWNKIDLPHAEPVSLPFERSVRLSAKKRLGLDALKEQIHHLIWQKGPPSKEEVIIANARHQQALAAAIASIDAVIEGLKKKISPEFVASDMRQALVELGSIIGTNITEEILSAIFSKFCIGK
jgi:tRNA modification GTPase